MKKRLVLGLALVAGIYWIGSKTPERQAMRAPAPVELATPRAVEAPTSPTPSTPSPALPMPAPVEPKEPASVALTPSSLFVRFHRVALRAAPVKGARILDRFDIGKRLIVLETKPGWTRVRDELAQREGWIANNALQEQAPDTKSEPAAPQEKPRQKPVEQKGSGLSTALIIQKIIAASLASYPSSCACPYNVDRGGRKCGRRSAYSKPGGYAPICFPSDVTSEMIAAFRD